MALPSSGSVSFSAIQTEFGGSNPISISEYYRAGSFVADNIPANANIPTSGQISVNQFYGALKPYVFNATISANTNNYNVNTAATSAGWNGVTPLLANITVNSGVTVSATVTTTAAMTIGTMPAGSIVNVTNNGVITGLSGTRGTYDRNVAGGANGKPGGVGILSSALLNLTNNNVICGGGGAGGMGGDNRGSLCIDTGGANGGAGGSAITINANITITNNGTIGGGGGGGGGGAIVLLGGCGTTVSASGGGGGGGMSYSSCQGGISGCYRFCSDYGYYGGTSGTDGSSSGAGSGGAAGGQNGQVGGVGGAGGFLGNGGSGGESRSTSGGGGGAGGRAVTINSGSLSFVSVGTIYGAY
jgi:hypothetical protein